MMSTEACVTPAGGLTARQDAEDRTELVSGAGRFASPHLNDDLENAGRLLAYAAEKGIEISAEHRAAVLTAIADTKHGWTPKLASDFLAAFTLLARKTEPVTGQSLKACVPDRARQQTKKFAFFMWGLLPLLVLFSVADFYASKLCEQIQTDLNAAQALAVKLNDKLFNGKGDVEGKRVPVKHEALNQSEIIGDLTQFAILTRAINTNATMLGIITFPYSTPPFSDFRELELDAELAQLDRQAVAAIERFQNIRHFAQTVRSSATLLYGAALQCVLPMMYAILGTLAYLLRTFDRQVEARTFTGNGKHTARFATAAIAGMVVGLFNLDIASLTATSASQTPAVSPLAIAFIVGYAVDVFFNFVETLTTAFARSRTEAARPSVP